MKTFFALLMSVLSILWLALVIGLVVSGEYRLSKKCMSYWNLADKASTLDAKSEYINQFVKSLDAHDFSEYNAIWLKTPNNSFERNVSAVKTLQARLLKIKTLDENSFAYQTAIQQITAQEQGEAKEMLIVISGCWWMKNCFIMWNWFGYVFWSILFTLLIAGWLKMDDF